MKAVVRFFSHNWSLKLLALVLALIVYYSMRESIRSSGGTSISPKGSFDDRPQITK